MRQPMDAAVVRRSNKRSAAPCRRCEYTPAVAARRGISVRMPAGRILLRDLRDLREHATQPGFVYRHAWRPGDLVLWDNPAVMRRGCRYDLTEIRDRRRTTVLDPTSLRERDCGDDRDTAN